MVISGLDDIIMVTLIGTGCNLVPITVTGYGNFANTNLHYFPDRIKVELQYSAKYRVTNFEIHKPDRIEENIIP